MAPKNGCDTTRDAHSGSHSADGVFRPDASGLIAPASIREKEFSFSPSTIEGIALYLWKAEKRRNFQRRRVWVHNIICKRRQLGEFHRLLKELRLDDGRFQRYFRLNVSQFDDLLARVGARISGGHQLQAFNLRCGAPVHL